MLLIVFSVFLQTALIRGAACLPPVVKLDDAIVTGTSLDGTIHKFLGIPFAEAPTGDLLFRLPQAVDAYTGTLNATSFGPECPQQSGVAPNTDGLPADVAALVLSFNPPFPSDEDCLSINVVKPADAVPYQGLPVVVPVCLKGGFEVGGTAPYDGGVIVNRSIEIEQPIIYVSMNYRFSAWGFLASKEVKEAGVGNLGLQDQRLALRWVQKYIHAFGGDPTKVTIWGQSSGAISVATQLIANDGNSEGLFRAAFMQSGSPLPVGDIEHGQKYYDDIVSKTGCTGSPDTLACLRTVPYESLKAAVDASPFIFDFQSLNVAWMPRTDGIFLTDDAQRLVQQGKIAAVPVVSGDCDDEGTIFSLSQRNITTDADMKNYMQTILFPLLAEDDIDTLMDVYPSSLEDGSPFDTGDANALTPQFKRLAALQGDFVFQGPRRFFLSAMSGKQDIYSYVHRRLKQTPFLGSFHGSDVSLNTYALGGDLQDYLIRFVANLDPNSNGDTGITWPKWTTDSPQLVSFNDGSVSENITDDTYRKEAMETLNAILFENPV
ncbi:carotenoid ester lipase precursor [Hymenopellis radicata]|nr:carotenoid ester lipase precursor [Hymenopellis radicata]